MSLPSIIPAGKYVAIFDQYGESKVLSRPTNKSILVYDGDDFFWADGTDALPVTLTDLKESTGQMVGIAGILGNGRIFNFAGANDSKRRLVCEAGIIEWEAIVNDGMIPTAGFGVVKRDQGGQDSFLADIGVVYINDDGEVVSIGNGLPGQVLTISGGSPQWVTLPSGNVSSGTSGIALSAAKCSNTSSNVVAFTIPQIGLTNGVDDIKVSNVSVSASLAVATGLGGLDTGAEAANTWYYLYVTSDGLGAVDCIISTSSTAPDLTATAHTYYVLVSVFRNDASANIINFLQRNRKFWTDPQTYSNNVAITTSWVVVPSGVSLATLVPPLVKSVSGNAGGSSVAAALVGMSIASTVNGLGKIIIGSRDVTTSSDSFKMDAGAFIDLPIADSGAPSLFWKGTVANSNRRIEITGYEI